MTSTSERDLDNRFNFHPATDPAVGETHDAIRSMCKDLAVKFNNTLPPSREASLALTKLEEAMFWANAAIARNS